MADGAWIKERWLECLCIGTTIVFSISGWIGVIALGRYAASNFYAFLGAGLPAPTQYVVDLAYEPLSPESLPALLPTGLAVFAGWLLRRGWRLVGATLLVLAPQFALLEIILALAAIALPYLSVSYKPR